MEIDFAQLDCRDYGPVFTDDDQSDDEVEYLIIRAATLEYLFRLDELQKEIQLKYEDADELSCLSYAQSIGVINDKDILRGDQGVLQDKIESFYYDNFGHLFYN